MGWLRGLVGLLLVVLVLGGIATVAYQAGVRNTGDDVAAVTVAGGTTAGESGVVIVRDRGWGGSHPFGFFGFLLFGLLLFVLLKALFCGAMFGGRRGGGSGGWRDRGRELHDEWHRSGGASDAGASGSGTAR